MSGQPLLLFAAEPKPQVVRDLCDDSILNREDIRKLCRITVRPKSSVGRHIHQVHLDVQIISTRRTFSCDDGSDVEFSTNLTRIRQLSLVATRCRSMNNAQGPHL